MRRTGTAGAASAPPTRRIASGAVMITQTAIHEPTITPRSKMRAVAEAKRRASSRTARARIGKAAPITSAGIPISASRMRNDVAK